MLLTALGTSDHSARVACFFNGLVAATDSASILSPLGNFPFPSDRCYNCHPGNPEDDRVAFCLGVSYTVLSQLLLRFKVVGNSLLYDRIRYFHLFLPGEFAVNGDRRLAPIDTEVPESFKPGPVVNLEPFTGLWFGLISGDMPHHRLECLKFLIQGGLRLCRGVFSAPRFPFSISIAPLPRNGSSCRCSAFDMMSFFASVPGSIEEDEEFDPGDATYIRVNYYGCPFSFAYEVLDIFI